MDDAVIGVVSTASPIHHTLTFEKVRLSSRATPPLTLPHPHSAAAWRGGRPVDAAWGEDGGGGTLTAALVTSRPEAICGCGGGCAPDGRRCETLAPDQKSSNPSVDFGLDAPLAFAFALAGAAAGVAAGAADADGCVAGAGGGALFT